MKHAVVTGGAGFLGSHLVDLLLERGWKVTAVDNLITGSRENISHNQENPNFTFLEQDICEGIGVDEKVDFVFNLASPASPIDYLQIPIETLMVGSYGTQNALELALKNQCGFLTSSTSEVYGDPLVHPQKEDYWGNVNPVGPRGCYDESKRYSEAITMAYHRKYGLETRIVRIFNTYGPRMRLNDGRVVPAFISQALRGEPMTVFGDGKQTRSFCYASDLIEGIYRLSQSDERMPTNIGNPTELTVLEFAEVIRRHTGAKSEIVFEPLPTDDPKQRRPDISKAKAVLGWEPVVGLDEGIERTIEYFKTRV